MPLSTPSNRFALVAVATLALWTLGGRIALAQTAPPADPKAAITKVLKDQAVAWNRGDLDAFLEGYWKSPKVVFQSGGSRHDGFDAMRDRYRNSYQANGKAMGQLSFSGVEIEPLGVEAAFVRGRFALAMPDGAHPSGLFTLILRRFDDGWKITHDHTSTAEAASPPVAASDPAIPPAPAAPEPPRPPE